MKKMIDKPIEERLAFWIQDDHYRLIATSETIIEEKKTDGAAQVRCLLPPGKCYELTLEGKAVTHLKSQKCTDGILLIETSAGEWELHIIECKKTINKTKWQKTKIQFETTIQRALGLLAGIGIHPKIIKLYTAVRTQDIVAEKNADPILSKMTISQWRKLTDEEKEKLHYMDWFDNQIDIWIERNIPHTQIKLDDEGNGLFHLI